VTERPSRSSHDEQMLRLEHSVSAVLRAGVLTSSAVIAAGVTVTMVTRSSLDKARRSVGLLRRGLLEPPSLRAPHSVASVVQGLTHGTGPAIVMLGLLLLILTPVMRVAVSVVEFLHQHDRRFVVITLGVLAVLLGSFAVGI
jgi:uncharacterized membrane protein